MQAVNDNGDLMRMAIASPGNDFRYACMYVCMCVLWYV